MKGSRSRILLGFTAMVVAPLAGLCDADVPESANVPKSVEELWADVDPRKDPLESEVIREWKEEGMVLRAVRFLVGTFKGKPARLAAFYGFAEGAKDPLPGVMQIHGGGGRASVDDVKLLTARGDAVLSVNWGGHELEGANPGEANTDWGAVDPTQKNVPGYSSMLPGPKQFYEEREHPKNNNWYLLTLGCRRGLTFLEQQQEVDPQRLGVHGYSMGGNLTMYVAGTDRRVKAAVVGVGGQGFRTKPHQFLGGYTWQQEKPKGNAEIFARTLGFESYAPLIHCPVMHRSATNDHHGWMDDVYRTDALNRGRPARHAWSPHLDHALLPEVSVTMPLTAVATIAGSTGPARSPTRNGAAPTPRNLLSRSDFRRTTASASWSSKTTSAFTAAKGRPMSARRKSPVDPICRPSCSMLPISRTPPTARH